MPLCKVMRRELKKQGITHLKVLYSKEKPVKTDPDKWKKTGDKTESSGKYFFCPSGCGTSYCRRGDPGYCRALMQAEEKGRSVQDGFI